MCSYIYPQVYDHLLRELGAASDRIHHAGVLLLPGDLLTGEPHGDRAGHDDL